MKRYRPNYQLWTMQTTGMNGGIAVWSKTFGTSAAQGVSYKTT